MDGIVRAVCHISSNLRPPADAEIRRVSPAKSKFLTCSIHSFSHLIFLVSSSNRWANEEASSQGKTVPRVLSAGIWCNYTGLPESILTLGLTRVPRRREGPTARSMDNVPLVSGKWEIIKRRTYCYCYFIDTETLYMSMSSSSLTDGDKSASGRKTRSEEPSPVLSASAPLPTQRQCPGQNSTPARPDKSCGTRHSSSRYFPRMHIRDGGWWMADGGCTWGLHGVAPPLAQRQTPNLTVACHLQARQPDASDSAPPRRDHTQAIRQLRQAAIPYVGLLERKGKDRWREAGLDCEKLELGDLSRKSPRPQQDHACPTGVPVYIVHRGATSHRHSRIARGGTNGAGDRVKVPRGGARRAWISQIAQRAGSGEMTRRYRDEKE
ncbi:uncharacterized protein N7482_006850 [Penicillium canariense]|uniref:Uncharacterized protein n=1 Tax=Penicillium canariense TaxID=189055 RepID=A0A9W9HYC3_9EURO|nr:uncharacterized protein N7482_006850 [Penicillium canariense]KAJ5159846.1 hypothetical protein N7482_006850 [Penicillium canariense]